MTDLPIAHTVDGRPLFDNTPTVVCMLVRHHAGLVVIRRANQPGYGLLGLPGGYHMRGESWQLAGAREVAEETGYVIDPAQIRQFREVVTDTYGNNLIIGLYRQYNLAYDTALINPDETLEVLSQMRIGSAEEWAFPLHYAAAVELMR
ncbi:NUDIX domain-containing protein [Mesorhizobium sp.]|uniref:NUDIX domain-containing protein n=1 Tax=Mesorhizobium sp. TaxID=1871066 RepID=UPI000FE3C4E0|nr:NUDIX domain-containing protein [Mesorhizobium sp.]RWI35534.1 MAG: NUDIX domain-containing protein [Mesorhizobium sp.]RWJ03470.1 MAG: NUDIX domain-containing protein [Mesorhizobium sp.]RWJ66297.1 MAG: NUDIX domain-containing protein [Mesorhizobium sp.]